MEGDIGCSPVEVPAKFTTQYLNKLLVDVGVAPIEEEGAADECPSSVSAAIYALLQRVKTSMQNFTKVNDKLRVTTADLERYKATAASLQEQLYATDKKLFKAEALLEKQSNEFSAEKDKLVEENKSLNQKYVRIASRDHEYQAKMRKQEDAYAKLKEMLQKEVRRREPTLKRGMTCSSKRPLQPAGRPSKDKTLSGPAGGVDASAAHFQRIIDGCEEKIATMEAENAANIDCVVGLERKVAALTNAYERLRRSVMDGKGAFTSVVGTEEDTAFYFPRAADLAPVGSPSPSKRLLGKGLDWAGPRGREGVNKHLLSQMEALSSKIQSLTDGSDPGLAEASLQAKLAQGQQRLEEAQQVIQQQHVLLQRFLEFEGSTLTSASEGLEDPEALWSIRELEAELADKEAKLESERSAVTKQAIDLQQERMELNMKWLAFEQARQTFVSAFPGTNPPGTPSTLAKPPLTPSAFSTPALLRAAQEAGLGGGSSVSGSTPASVNTAASASRARRRKLKMGIAEGPTTTPSSKPDKAARKPLTVCDNGNSVIGTAAFGTPLQIAASPATRALIQARNLDQNIRWMSPEAAAESSEVTAKHKPDPIVIQL